MANRFIYFIILTQLAFFSIGCQATKEPIPKKQEYSISQSIQIMEKNTIIKVKKGEHFEISLNSNPSTGYGWETEKELDENIIKEIDKVFANARSSEEPAPVGVGGKEAWTFEAVSTGEFTFKMIYCQPFNRSQPADEKTIQVIIE